VDCEPTLAAREQTLEQVVARTGATFIHPYDDPRIIAGQGTAALELLEDIPELDVLMAPVGGGGLMSGTALAAAGLRAEGHAHATLRILGAEPEGADDACRSLLEGRRLPSVDPRTVCDGLLTSLGHLNFAALRAHLEGIITASEEAILQALRLVLERMKLVVEPSAVVPLAVLLQRKPALGDLRGQQVGIILSGGNLSVDGLLAAYQQRVR
jgi:threonine dehydratase